MDRRLDLSCKKVRVYGYVSVPPAGLPASPDSAPVRWAVRSELHAGFAVKRHAGETIWRRAQKGRRGEVMAGQQDVS